MHSAGESHIGSGRLCTCKLESMLHWTLPNSAGHNFVIRNASQRRVDQRGSFVITKVPINRCTDFPMADAPM